MIWNVGNILIVVGCGLLGVTLWVPYATARRVARIEGRAEQMTRDLLARAVARMPIDFAQESDGAALLEGPDTGRLEQIDRQDTGLDRGYLYQGKHYLFAVLPSLQDWPPDQDDDTGPRPIEIYAWPRSYLEGGRTVFFFPSDAAPAYTRNLLVGYAGFERVPSSGRGRPVDSRAGDSGYYRGLDDERWLPLARDPPR